MNSAEYVKKKLQQPIVSSSADYVQSKIGTKTVTPFKDIFRQRQMNEISKAISDKVAKDKADYEAYMKAEEAYNNYDFDASKREIDSLREELNRKKELAGSTNGILAYQDAKNDVAAREYDLTKYQKGTPQYNAAYNEYMLAKNRLDAIPNYQDVDLSPLEKQLAEKESQFDEFSRMRELKSLVATLDQTKTSEYLKAAEENPSDIQTANEEQLDDVRSRFTDAVGVAEYPKLYFGNAMTKDQKELYSLFYGKALLENGGDKKKAEAEADKYLHLIERELNDIIGQNFAKDNPALLTAVVSGIMSGVSGLGFFLTGNKYNPLPSAPALESLQYASAYERENLEGAERVFYDILNTSANTLPSVLVGLVPGMGPVASGVNAGGNATAETLRLGYSKEQAVAYGILVGAVEGATSAALSGISQLGGTLTKNVIQKAISKIDNAVARAAITLGGKIVSEGLEEGLQEVIDPFLKAIATGEDVELAKWDEILYAAVLGAASGGMFGGVNTAVSMGQQLSQGSRVQNQGVLQDYVDTGLAQDTDTDAFAVASRIQEAQKQNKPISKSQAGRLVNEVNAITKSGATKQSGKVSEEAVRAMLEGKGVTEDVDSKAKIISDYLNKGVISKADRKTVVNDATLTSVMNAFRSDRRISLTPEVQEKLGRMETASANNLDEANIKNAVELDISISDDGKTRLASTGEEVSISEVQKITPDGVTLKLSDGREVDANDVQFADEDTANAFRTIATTEGMTSITANKLLKSYSSDMGVSLDRYVETVTHSYENAVKGYAPIEPKASWSEAFTRAVDDAYERGLNHVKSEETTKRKQKEAKAEHRKNELRRTANKGIDSKQQKVVDFGKSLGIKVAFIDTEKIDGFKSDGFFEDGVIYIDKNTQDPVIFVLKHEMAHYGERAKAKYASFKKAVLKSKAFETWIKEQSVLDHPKTRVKNLEGFITEYTNAIITRYAEHGKDLSRTSAEAEMIANFVGDNIFKGKGTLEESLAKMTAGLDVKESNAVVGFIKDFIAWVKSKVQKLGMSFEDVRLQRLFAESVVSAKNTVRAKENTTVGGVELRKMSNSSHYLSKSMTNDASIYSYDFLTKLPPLSVVNLPNAPIVQGKIDKSKVIELGLRNAKKAGEERDGKFFVTNVYTGKKLNITKSAIKHGLDGNYNRLLTNARLGLVIGDVVKEAVPINALNNTSESASATYVMAAYARDVIGREVVAIITVEQHSGDITDIATYETVHAISGRQKKGSQADTKSPSNNSIKATKISISNFLQIVNSTHRSILSKDVLLHLNQEAKSTGTYAKDVLFSIPKAEAQYTIPDEAKANADKAAKHFGTTSRINEAGYILVDGRMLDMSGKHDGAPGGYRTVDHRDVKEALGLDYGGDDYSGAMVQFMSEGNIRIAPESGGINVSVMPNQFQRGALTRFINKFGGEVVLDIDDLRGNTVASVEYPYGTSASVVLKDVSDYFEIGKLPESFDTQYSYSIPDERRALRRRLEAGQITKEQYDEGIAKLADKARKEFGTIETGARSAIDPEVPARVTKERKTRRYVSNILESGAVSEAMGKEFLDEIIAEGFSFEELSDKEAITYASRYKDISSLTKAWGGVLAKEDSITRGIGKNDIAVGSALLQNAIASGDGKLALEVASDISRILTNAGQVVQAAKLFKAMTGTGKLVTLQKIANKFNDSLKRKGKNQRVSIDPSIAEALVNAMTDEEVSFYYEKAVANLAEQLSSTVRDKMNAVRYMAMLLNPTTHVRNLSGNALFVPLLMMKNLIATGGEVLFLRDHSKRTKSLVMVGDSYWNFAVADLKKPEVKEILEISSKFNDTQGVEKQKPIFDHRWLEAIREISSFTLSFEDSIFKSVHYKMALASFLKARKVDISKPVSENVMHLARKYATQEALKATFNDYNKLATALNRMCRKYPGFAVAIDAFLPFKSTPMNIVKRAIEYSPAGLIVAIGKRASDFSKAMGDYNFAVSKGLEASKPEFINAQLIDDASASAAGTAVFIIGMLMRAAGLAIGGMGDDDEDEFRKLNGEQEYSVQIGDSSYTMSWAAPQAIPFFMGVEFYDAVTKDGYSLNDLSDSFFNMLNPILDLSVLSGIDSVMSTIKYSDGTETIGDALVQGVSSYVGQFFPTFLGQITKATDPVRRSNYVGKDPNGVPDFVEKIYNNILSKSIFFSNKRPAYVDAWGRKEVSKGAQRYLEPFLSPGYYSNVSYDDLNEEILRLYSTTQDTKVFPSYSVKKVTLTSKDENGNAETYYFSGAEWEKYAMLKGRQSYEYVDEFMSGEYYDELSDAQKVEVISDLYSYAAEKARIEVTNDSVKVNYSTVSVKDKKGGSSAVIEYYAMNQLAEKYERDNLYSLFDEKKYTEAKAFIKESYKFRVDKKVKEGEDRKEAEADVTSSFKSSMTQYWKSKYKEASDSERATIRNILWETGLYERKSAITEMCRRWLRDKD